MYLRSGLFSGRQKKKSTWQQVSMGIRIVSSQKDGHTEGGTVSESFLDAK
jgi:hypothetical protein